MASQFCSVVGGGHCDRVGGGGNGGLVYFWHGAGSGAEVMQNDSGCGYLAVSLESGWRRGGEEEGDGRSKSGEEKGGKKGRNEWMRATTADDRVCLAGCSDWGVLDAETQ